MLRCTKTPTTSALEGVVVCLSGFPADEKDRLHRMVEAMGGRYTRDLLLTETTHLVTVDACGAKYDAATGVTGMHIVSPQWIEDCQTFMARICEREYLLSLLSALPHSKQDRPRKRSVSEILQDIHNQDDPSYTDNCSLFSKCHFYLLGKNENNCHDSLLLSKLIRRGLGTIHWNCLDIELTHVVVIAPEDEPLDAKRCAEPYSYISREPPCFVSARWVLDSYQAGRLQSTANYVPPQFKLPPKAIK